MNAKRQAGEIRMIAIDHIEVINPRERNSRVFEEIVGNIKTIGLKKPITVTPRAGSNGTEKSLLVCGEGRLRHFARSVKRLFRRWWFMSVTRTRSS